MFIMGFLLNKRKSATFIQIDEFGIVLFTLNTWSGLILFCFKGLTNISRWTTKYKHKNNNFVDLLDDRKKMYVI